MNYDWLTVWNGKRFVPFDNLPAVVITMMAMKGYSLLGRRRYNTVKFLKPQELWEELIEKPAKIVESQAQQAPGMKEPTSTST